MSDQYGSFLDLNLDEVPELKTVEPNREYELRIEGAEIKESKGEKTAGQSMLNIRCSIPSEPDTQQVYEIVMLPHGDADEEQNNQRKRQLKRLLESIGLDISRGFNIDELVGLTFWAILDVETYQGEDRNRIKRYMAPQT
jgi:hypothetical protein